MALFGKKEEEKEEAVAGEAKAVKTENKEVEDKKVAPKKETIVDNIDYSWVLLKPRVTEKSAMMGGGNVYTFDVAPRSNKIIIKAAIKSIYGVTPKKVTIIVGKQKKVIVRGRQGVQAGYKKAMVFLKKGDSIEFS